MNDTDDAMEADTDGARPPFHQLSCLQCRNKKVKCDRRDPCTPCTVKQIPCTFPAGVKARQRRQRALVSNNYEAKIDEIVKKLDRICVAVDGLGDDGSSSGIRTTPMTTSTHHTPPPPNLKEEGRYNEDSGSETDGDLSLNAHAAFATDYASRVMAPDHATPQVNSSLGELKQMIELAEKRPNPADQLSLSSQLFPTLLHHSDLKMPPMQLAMDCLQRTRESPRLQFFWSWEPDSLGQVVEYFLSVYSGKPSLAEMIIANAALFRLFSECSNEESHEPKKIYLQEQAFAARGNLDIILSKLPFNLPSTFDYVLALFEASMHYLERCKPSLAWKYICASCQMCYTLGFNRDVARVPESETQKRRRIRLFWFIAMLDKCLSLRLGRPSSLRDGEITVRKLDESDDGGLPVFPAVPKWMDWSIMQGKIYDDLFSPSALLQPESIRTARARALAVDLQAIYDSVCPIESRYLAARKSALGDAMDKLFERADKVAHLSTLTLIYRAIPAGPYSRSAFCQECASMAHEALEEHQRCIETLRNVQDNIVEVYLQWTILASPFVPFIVLFCRAIETSDPSHLEQLASVIEVLQLAPKSLPDEYRKQLRLFKLMYDVANQYIAAQGKGTTQNHESRRMVSGDFDTLFRGAGLDFPLLSQMDDIAGQELMSMGIDTTQLDQAGVDMDNWFS